jgi:hypothetical protein
MATLEQLQDELASVQKAVNAAYGAAEYEVQDGNTRRRLKRQDLSVLLKRKAELETSIARLDPQASGRGTSFGMPVDSNSCYNR